MRQAQKLKEWRENRDAYFIRRGDIDAPLDYFPWSKDFYVRATFSPELEDVLMETTKGDRPMQKTGTLSFTLKGTQCSLPIYGSFIPFRDQSAEVYKGGRYIDLKNPVVDNKVFLDFNRAYNPLCVYSPRYDCPIVPLESTLPVEVEAGEKVYVKKESYEYTGATN